MVEEKQFDNFDILFMQEALIEAKKAYAKGEVPVGAVIVLDGKILARAHNLCEVNFDATAHAERLCIQKASWNKKNWRLNNATLYTTLEPCPMCGGAAILSRIKKIVWGCEDLRHGSHGSWIDLFSKPHPIHQIKIQGGLFREESKQLLKAFFKQQRKENYGSKRTFCPV